MPFEIRQRTQIDATTIPIRRHDAINHRPQQTILILHAVLSSTRRSKAGALPLRHPPFGSRRCSRWPASNLPPCLDNVGITLFALALLCMGNSGPVSTASLACGGGSHPLRDDLLILKARESLIFAPPAPFP